MESTDKIVLSIIIDHIGQNADGWPGVRTLAKETGLDKDTISKSIARLEEAGRLIINNRGRGTLNHYSLPDKSVREIRTVDKGKSVRKPRTVQNAKCPEDTDTGVRKPRTEVSVNPVHNQTDQSNQTIPDLLNTPEFVKCWEQWKQYRRELKKPLAPTTEGHQLKKLAGHDVDTAIAMLEQSMEKGWQGIFELKGDTKSKVTDFTGGDPRLGYIPGLPIPGSEG